MKIRLIALLSLFTYNAYSQDITCLDKLMPTSRHSGLHQLTKEEWSEITSLDINNAKRAITVLTQNKLFCNANEVVIKVEPVCTNVIADIPQSNACFVFTNLGYFWITMDNGKNTNFVFSKDKRFAD